MPTHRWRTVRGGSLGRVKPADLARELRAAIYAVPNLRPYVLFTPIADITWT